MFNSAKTAVQVLESRDLLADPVDPSDTRAVRSNLTDVRFLFESHVECAQLAIRHNFADPRPPLRKAVAVAERCASRWNEMTRNQQPWPPLAVSFNFSLAALISLLIRKDVPPAILAVMPSVPAWRPEDTRLGALFTDFTGVPSAFCDSGLLFMMQHKRRPRFWSSILAILDSRTCLWHETYTVYSDIIFNAHAGRWVEAWQAVETAHELYEDRGRKDYNEFLAWEGVKPGNEHWIDIRLTVLIHCCFPTNRVPRESPANIHCLNRPGMRRRTTR
jgi:hypothetical protein